MQPINIFDFDGTLTTDTWPKCFAWVNKFGFDGSHRNEKLEVAIEEYKRAHERGDWVDFYGFFNDLITENNSVITHDELVLGHQFVEFNPGVAEYFGNTKTKNYIVSSGIREFLASIPELKNVIKIYGSEIEKNADGDMLRVAKYLTDEKKINAIKEIMRENGREDCQNIYYIGDGDTDASALEFVHVNGGKAIFVYRATRDAHSDYADAVYVKMQAKGIVDGKMLADFSDGSELNKLLNRI